jgi:hypothetical protein
MLYNILTDFWTMSLSFLRRASWLLDDGRVQTMNLRVERNFFFLDFAVVFLVVVELDDVVIERITVSVSCWLLATTTATINDFSSFEPRQLQD